MIIVFIGCCAYVIVDSIWHIICPIALCFSIRWNSIRLERKIKTQSVLWIKFECAPQYYTHTLKQVMWIWAVQRLMSMLEKYNNFIFSHAHLFAGAKR